MPTIRSLDEREMLGIIQHVYERIETVDMLRKRTASLPDRLIENNQRKDQVNLEANFTEFGKGLARACGLLTA